MLSQCKNVPSEKISTKDSKSKRGIYITGILLYWAKNNLKINNLNKLIVTHYNRANQRNTSGENTISAPRTENSTQRIER